LWEASSWQATLGKRLLNIYVTDDNRQRISLGRSVGRWLARWICSWFGGNLISVITIASTFLARHSSSEGDQSPMAPSSRFLGFRVVRNRWRNEGAGESREKNEHCPAILKKAAKAPSRNRIEDAR
jgi:RDD family